MKKTLIALSLAALSTAAVADVTLYGQIRAGVEVSQTKQTGWNDKKKETPVTTQIQDLGSRIGFKGHENLGNGLNAIWKLEQSTSVAGTDSRWASRLGYIGLESQAGTIKAGKVGTALDDMGQVDPWIYKNKALGLSKFTRTGEKVVSVRYDSPVVAGFSGNVQYVPRDNQADTGRSEYKPDANDKGDTSAYYAGLNYENAGFFAKYGFGLKKEGYSYKDAASKTHTGDAQVHRVEGGYNANNIAATVGYQFAKGWGDARKVHEVAVTGAYSFGNVTPKVSYAHGFKAKDIATGKKQNDSEYEQVVVGVDYDFSKRTTAFAQAGWLKENGVDTSLNSTGEGKTKTTAGLVGLVHKF
ncbi:MAG: porin [Neisseria sp.]|nr:porin [Neisseria sp.]